MTQVSSKEIEAALARVDERDRLADMAGPTTPTPTTRARDQQRAKLALDGALYWNRRHDAVRAADARRSLVMALRPMVTTPLSASDRQLEQVEKALVALVVHLDVGFAEMRAMVEQLEVAATEGLKVDSKRKEELPMAKGASEKEATGANGRDGVEPKAIHHERLDQFEAILHVHLAALCASQERTQTSLARLMPTPTRE